MLNKFDNIPEEVKRKCVAEVITRVEEMSGSEVGIIAAQDIIDIVTQNLGPEIYNMALHDTKKLLQSKLADLEYEVDALKQQA